MTMRKRVMGLEFTMRKSVRVRVHHEKNNGVRVNQKKEAWGKSSP